MIDLRSDTKTLPTEEMLDAMHHAELGDSKAGEDPTVKRFEALAAKHLGKESAMLVISSTMANLIAHLTLAGAGEAIVLDPETHVYRYEGGSFCLGGRIPALLPSDDGLLVPDEIERHIKSMTGWIKPRVLHLENTHVMSGGRVVPIELHKQHCAVARRHGLSIHLDGARLFNAEAATGVPVAKYAAAVDSVLICLSKNLSAPLGAVLCGNREFIKRAKYFGARLGGGMRQAGVIAAAGIIAFETMTARLVEDHAHARFLAARLNAMPGFSVNLSKVESNMIRVEFSGTHRAAKELIADFAKVGVLVGEYPGYLRFVIHRHHTRSILNDAAERMAGVLIGKR